MAGFTRHTLTPKPLRKVPTPGNLQLREPLGDWSTGPAADAGVDSSHEPCPEEFYRDNLSVAPGWKVGGYASWGLTDPVPQFCPACDTEMDPLLTIATFEWDDSTRGWIPDADCEDQARTRPSPTHTGSGAQAVIDFFRAKGLEVHDRGRVPSDIRAAPPIVDPVPTQPTAVQIGRGYRQQPYVCPTSPEHPHTELMQ